MGTQLGCRMFALSKIMIADRVRAKGLMHDCPEIATKKINALGYDFTIEEVSNYARIARPVILGTKSGKCDVDVYGGLAWGDEPDFLISLVNANWDFL